jgi:AGCS family alanine or glycine:cation symporter
MTILVFAFAFSSVIGNYAYAEVNLSFLRIKPSAALFLRLAALLAVLTGSITALPIVWALADVAMGLMTLVNVGAILLLWPWVKIVLSDYDQALALGHTPQFVARNQKNLPPSPADMVW